MTPVAAILEWKLGEAYFRARCRTHEIDGDMRITRWDAKAAGRPEPTEAEIATWAQEFAAREPELSPDEKLDDALRRLGDLEAERLAR